MLTYNIGKHFRKIEVQIEDVLLIYHANLKRKNKIRLQE